MALKKKQIIYAGLLLTTIGIALLAYGYSQGIGDASYMSLLIDKNGDGVIDWRDCDVNHDGVLDIFDSIVVGAAMNTIQGQPLYNDACDLNGDHAISIIDSNILRAYTQQFRLLTLGFTEYFNTVTPQGDEMVIGLIALILGLGTAAYGRLTLKKKGKKKS